MFRHFLVSGILVATAAADVNLTHGRQLASPSLDDPKLCPQTVFHHGQDWPSAYYEHDCKLQPTLNTTRTSVREINLVVMSPYVGALGDVMSVAEPLLAEAAQEIEDSNLLPGFRVNFHLADSRCTTPDATATTVRAMSEGPIKHGLIGDSCSGSCVAINDALQYFNVLQISPNCISTALSDRDRHPYFARVVPSFRYYILAVQDTVKQFGWQRIGVLHGWRGIMLLAKDFFLELTAAEAASGEYPWTILMVTEAGTPEQAGPAADLVRQTDSRIVFTALYEDAGAQLMCAMAKRGMGSPDYMLLGAAGGWNNNFLQVREAETDCSVAEMYQAGYGTICFDRGGMVDADDVHGLSGRSLHDIEASYATKCNALFDGQGACGYQFTPYFYDAMWHFAQILHQHLIDEGGDYDTLASPAARQRLYDLSLQLDYLGITGRVRQFNTIAPTTDAYGGSFGDRDGTMLLKQLANPPPNEFSKLSYWSEDGSMWLQSPVWSLADPSKMVECVGSSCNMDTAWIPRDRDEAGCPAGSVWSLEAGCEPCPAGSFAEIGAFQCTECDAGNYQDLAGQSACIPCEEGTSAKAVASKFCTRCEAGSYTHEKGASACTWCERGRYADVEGASGCQDCSTDLTTVDIASRTVAECTCREGHYHSKQNQTCLPCQNGLECPVGSREANIGVDDSIQPLVKPGYYTLAMEPMSVYMCSDVALCPGGLPDSCPPHREGLTCSACAQGYFEDGNDCLECPPALQTRALFPILAMILIPPAILLAFAAMQHDDASLWYKPVTSLTVILTVALNYTQVIALHNVLQLQLPEVWKGVTGSASATITPLDALRMECNDFRGFGASYAARMLLPIFAAGLAGLAVLYGTALKMIFKTSFDAEKARSVICTWYGSLFVALYLSTTSQAFSLFMCYTHPNGKMSLRSTPEVLCNEAEWSSAVGGTVVAIMVYCVLSMVVIVALLWKAPALYSSKTFRISTTFIFKRFRVGAGYWVVILIIKGVWIALTSVAFLDVDGQIMWLNAGLLLYCLATAIVLPFRHAAVNWVDVSAHAMLVYVYNGSTFFAEVNQEVYDRVSIFSPVVACAYFLVPLVALGIQLMRTFVPQSKCDEENKQLAEAACTACAVIAAQPQRTAELLNHLSATEFKALTMMSQLVKRETCDKSIKAAGHLQILQHDEGPENGSQGVSAEVEAALPDPDNASSKEDTLARC